MKPSYKKNPKFIAIYSDVQGEAAVKMIRRVFNRYAMDVIEVFPNLYYTIYDNRLVCLREAPSRQIFKLSEMLLELTRDKQNRKEAKLARQKKLV